MLKSLNTDTNHDSEPDSDNEIFKPVSGKSYSTQVPHLMHKVYIKQIQPDGDILLVETKLSMDEFTYTHQHNGNILLNPISIIDPSDISNWNFKGSKIQHTIFLDPVMEKLTNPGFKKVYDTIYSIIDDGALIIKHSKLKIKTAKVTSRGYTWYPELGISVQGVDSNHSMREIVVQCQKNNIRIEMSILINGKTVKINS